MLTSTTWSGVSMKVETDTELTDLPTFKPNAILVDTLIQLKDTKRTGMVLETTGIEEATRCIEIQSVRTLKFKLISLKAQDTLLIITLSSDVQVMLGSLDLVLAKTLSTSHQNLKLILSQLFPTLESEERRHQIDGLNVKVDSGEKMLLHI